MAQLFTLIEGAQIFQCSK